MTKRVSFIEIDLIKCSNTYGQAPCTASVGVTGEQKCFNCRATCQDLDNITEAPEVVRYSKPSTNQRFDLDAAPNITVPNIASISYAPPELMLGESIGVRASLNVSFKDHRSPDTDAAGDRYIDERNYDPYATGTYWGKFRARYPYLQGTKLRWIQGTADQNIADMETRTFVIEGVTGPDSAGNYSIKAKDVLKLTDGDRSQAPTAKAISNGATNIDATYTGNVDLANVGDAFLLPALGYVVLGGSEIVYGQIFGSDPTGTTWTILSRGQLGTTAVAHGVGIDFQDVLSFEGKTPAEILYSLLVDYAGVDPSFIPYADWEDETDTYYAKLLTGHIATPTAVVALVNDVIKHTASSMWWDNEAQLIRWQILKNPSTGNYNYNQSVTLQNTFGIKDDYSRRTSIVWVFFGQINPLLNLDEPSNYANIVQRREQQFDPFFDNKPAIKKIFSRWITGTSRDTAERLGDLILQRFSLPPRKVTLKLMRDSGVPVPVLGGAYNVQDTFTQTPTGEQASLPVQVTSIVPQEAEYTVTAEEITYIGIEPPDVNDVKIQLDFSRTDGVNLRDLYDAENQAPTASTVVTVTVAQAVVIGSTSTATPAISTGSWPAGATLRLVNRGFIVGRGGNGGNGANIVSSGKFSGSVYSTRSAVAGSNGGDAFQLDHDIEIDNQGVIGGGGGGGGGSGSAGQIIQPPSDWMSCGMSGGGGGGGAGSVSGDGGAAETYKVEGSALPSSVTESIGGNSGGLENGGGGSGPASSLASLLGNTVSSYIADAGDGGGLGQNGNTGGNGSNNVPSSWTTRKVFTSAGAAGGLAGKAIDLNGNAVTWTNMGDIRGAVS